MYSVCTFIAPISTAAVEELQPDAILAGDFMDRLLGFVQFPVGGEVAAVLVAVRIAEHDLLEVAARFQMVAVDRIGEQGLHDARCRTQVFDRLEQRTDVQSAGDAALRRPVEQAPLLAEQQHFQQVADSLGHRDQVVLDAGIPEQVLALAHRLQHVQRLPRARTELGVRRDDRARVDEEGGELLHFFRF
jgi:hypothetical protein